ncbi:MAG: cation:proton antiporter domain-containing protein [Syntrophorhabdaceae bacterium]
MSHSVSLITTIAASFGLALVLGLVAVRLKLPALVGYLVAGILLGPATPGFVADIELSGQLAEIGVILLMFGVGLHFSVDDLLAVRAIALPGAIVQIVAATALGGWMAIAWGWSIGAAITFGLALSVASTVVLLRTLELRGILESVNGRIAVGWLVVEDLAMVLVLVLLPPLSGWLVGDPAGHATGGNLVFTVFVTLGKIAAFIAFMLLVGKRVFPWLLWHVAGTGSRELFNLCIIAAAVVIAYGSAELFGVSFALGAFFAGMVMRESPLSHRAARESLPLRDAFSVLFFVSVGMLFDPHVLLQEPLHVLAVVGIIMVGKSLAAFALVLAFRYPLDTALTVSASLAQVGEFSFILVALGVSLGLITHEAQNLILIGAIISISANPLIFRTIEPILSWIGSRPKLARSLVLPDDPLAELPVTVNSEYVTGHTVVIGYGRVGRYICEALIERGIPFVVAEENRELVEELRARGINAVAGDATNPPVLIQSHIARARILVIATPDCFSARRMIETAYMLNPGIHTIVRTHSEEEAELLRKEKAGAVFLGEYELAASMVGRLLEEMRNPSQGQTPV